MAKRARGTGGIYQRGRGHWIRYRPGRGLPERRESVECGCPVGRKTCEQAERVLRERLTLVDRGAIRDARDERITVAGAIDLLIAAHRDRGAKAIVRTESHLKPVRAHLGAVRVLALRPEHFAAYKAARLAVVAQGTVHTEMAHLRAAVSLLRKTGRLLHVPFVPVPPRGAPRRGYLEPEAFPLLLAEMRPARRPDPELYREMTEFAYAIGWRYSEVTGLTWANVFLRDGELRLDESKTGWGRTIAIEGRVREILEARWAKRDMASPWVFHNHGRRVSDGLRRHIKAAGAAIGITVIPHDLRRSAARDLRRAGDKRVAMSITGHRSEQVFDEHYNPTSARDTREILRAVEAYRAARVSESNVTAIAHR